jgi:hypothetical protein
MSISNREDANKYYHLINELVDDYIDKWKIRPSNLKKYLKPGSERFNKFLLRNKLSEVKGASVILSDIIEDRASMEKDGVLKFETFKYFESNDFKIDSLKECLYKGIEKADIKMEKILADFFDTNLSSIDILDAYKHLFKLENWENDDWKVIIYSKEDLDIIKENIIENIYKEINEKEVELSSNIKVSLSKLIDNEIFYKKMIDIFTEDNLIKKVTDLLGDNYSFKSKISSYFIWIS